jgi:hypothetical protein
MTFFGVVMAGVPFRDAGEWRVVLIDFRRLRAGAGSQSRQSNGVNSGFPRPDPDGFFNRRYENFPIANSPGLGGTTDRVDSLFDHVVTEHNLDLHLGQKIHHVLGAPI